MGQRTITAAELKRLQAETKAKKRRKFLNIPTTVDGRKFDSKAESERYSELMLRLRAREISELVLQPNYKMIINGLLVCEYAADFRYYDKLVGRTIVEDVKSKRTRTNAEYRIKVKLLKACHGIDIVEVMAK